MLSEGHWLRSESSRRGEEPREAQDPDGASQPRSREMVGQEDGAGAEEEIGKEGRRRAEKRARSRVPSPPIGVPGSHGDGRCQVQLPDDMPLDSHQSQLSCPWK